MCGEKQNALRLLHLVVGIHYQCVSLYTNALKLEGGLNVYKYTNALNLEGGLTVYNIGFGVDLLIIIWVWL